jgi:8-oxo-dGTP diphosphatase
MTSIKQTIFNIVDAIKPLDGLERQHKEDVLAWIRSDAPLFRVSKPDNPPKHLVSYFVVYDAHSARLMLVDHVTAGLWLPTGGHLFINEDPRTAVDREADEELQIKARFDTVFGQDPLFVTVTETKGAGRHTDVSLWYVISGKDTDIFVYDKREIHRCKWFSLQEVFDTDISELDPQMHRFVQKMQQVLSS